VNNSQVQRRQPFNGTLSGTTRVSWYQKGKTNLDLLEQEIVSGSGFSWTIWKSAPRPRQTPCQHPISQFFYRLDALPATQLTVSKHRTHKYKEMHELTANI